MNYMKGDKRILIIGLSCVGDVTMTTPVFESLHQVYSQAFFDVVADKRSISLYENCPYIDQIFIKDKSRFLRGTPSLIMQLRGQKYDLIVDLRTDFLSYLLKGKKRLTKRVSVAYGKHAVEDLMGVISELHGNKPIPAPVVWYTQKEEDYATQQLVEFNDSDMLLCVSLGDPSKPYKSWSVDKLVMMINQYQNQFVGLVMVGGPDEIEVATAMINEIKLPVVNCVGNSLLEAATILKRCRVYIGPDSGLGHLAAAVGTPTISFFSTVSAERYLPRGKQSIAIVANNGDARTITHEEVCQAVDSLMA